MTLNDLQVLAARQQVAIETQEQALVAREARLRYLEQQGAGQQELSGEQARLARMRERVQAQELKVQRLRALKSQAEQCHAHNGKLNWELEGVRAVFGQKEKELALAVSRVDSLLQQLKQVKAAQGITKGDAPTTTAGSKTALTLELEKLRKELMERREVNMQFESRLAAQKQALDQRKEQVSEVDARIQELQQRLRKRRSHPQPPPLSITSHLSPPPHPHPHSPPPPLPPHSHAQSPPPPLPPHSHPHSPPPPLPPHSHAQSPPPPLPPHSHPHSPPPPLPPHSHPHSPPPPLPPHSHPHSPPPPPPPRSHPHSHPPPLPPHSHALSPPLPPPPHSHPHSPPPHNSQPSVGDGERSGGGAGEAGGGHGKRNVAAVEPYIQHSPRDKSHKPVTGLSVWKDRTQNAASGSKESPARQTQDSSPSAPLPLHLQPGQEEISYSKNDNPTTTNNNSSKTNSRYNNGNSNNSSDDNSRCNNGNSNNSSDGNSRCNNSNSNNSSDSNSRCNNNNSNSNNSSDSSNSSRKVGEDSVKEYKIPPVISSYFNLHEHARVGLSGGRETVAGQTGHGEVGVGGSHHGPPLGQPSNTRGRSAGSSSCATSVSLSSFGKPVSLMKWPPPSSSAGGGGGGEGGGCSETSPSPHSLHPHSNPHHPYPHVNIFEEERQAGSGQSSPASSEGSCSSVLLKQGSGVFATSHHLVPAVTTTTPSSHAGRQPAASATCPALETQDVHNGGSPQCRGQQRAGKPVPPKPPPRMPQTVLHSRAQFSPSTTLSPTASSSDVLPSSVPSPPSASNAISTASSVSAGRPCEVVAQPGSGSDQDREQGTPGMSPEKARDAEASTPSGTEQGAEKERGSTADLGQKPLPAYSSTLITHIYTGGQGNSTRQPADSQERRAVKGNQTHSHHSTTGPDSHPGTSDSTPGAGEDAVDGRGVVGGGEGVRHLGMVVGPPGFPDITSDKGSYKSNTPKQVRRRHSDSSDNEELLRVLRKGEHRRDGQPLGQLTEDNKGDRKGEEMDQVTDDTTTNSPSSVTTPTTLPEEGVNPQKQKTTELVLADVPHRKRPILKGGKGNNQQKPSANHRVRFDPLALLLDASLEGELDLVTSSATEVEDVSRPNDEGITALHNAICAGHYPIVKFLVEFGADANSPDTDGWTPLHCAASCNNLPMVRFLVEHGACLFAATHTDHETPAEKCEEDEDGYDHCSDYLYGVQEKLGIANDGGVYAVFDFTASRQDELSVCMNDRLNVVRRGDQQESEWWWVTAPDNITQGYVPRNILGLCPRVLPTKLSGQSLQTSDC